MNTTITNNGLPKFPQASNSTSSGSAATSGTLAEKAVAAPRNGDQLKLTDSARALQDVARANDASPIDAKRVEEVRRALADGSYKVDAGRIADRMIAMDQQLGGTDKA
ncbi:negative regulator of flagellin synthesis FlgM [Rhodanobacter sp. TND4EL1]